MMLRWFLGLCEPQTGPVVARAWGGVAALLRSTLLRFVGSAHASQAWGNEWKVVSRDIPLIIMKKQPHHKTPLVMAVVLKNEWQWWRWSLKIQTRVGKSYPVVGIFHLWKMLSFTNLLSLPKVWILSLICDILTWSENRSVKILLSPVFLLHSYVNVLMQIGAAIMA